MYSTQNSLQGKMLSFKTMCLKKGVFIWSFAITHWHTTLRPTTRLLSFAICLLEHRECLLFSYSFINHLTSGKVQAVGNMDVPNEMGTKYSSGIFTVKAFLVVTVQKKSEPKWKCGCILNNNSWMGFICDPIIMAWSHYRLSHQFINSEKNQ